jgi:hypothetical protein
MRKQIKSLRVIIRRIRSGLRYSLDYSANAVVKAYKTMS